MSEASGNRTLEEGKGRGKLRLFLCNEVLRELDFARQCDLAAALGYEGLEVAPFTLSDEPHRLSEREAERLRRHASESGITIVGLHWLLTAPAGLSITTEESAVRARTLDVMRALVDLCAALGGSVLVHGSPQQRVVTEREPAGAAARGRAAFAAIASHAQAAGLTYCIEPLSLQETRFVNTVAEAAEIVDEVGNPALKTMIDFRAARLAEAQPLAELITQWLPTGKVAHVHLNDSNRRAPGQGEDEFAPALAALRAGGYRGAASVEPFVYEPDGATTAAFAVGYLKGLDEALDLASPPAGDGM